MSSTSRKKFRMANENKSILRGLLSTESEWNLKVVIARGVVRV